VKGVELYNHTSDAYENNNVANLSGYEEIQGRLTKLLKEKFGRRNKEYSCKN